MAIWAKTPKAGHQFCMDMIKFDVMRHLHRKTGRKLPYSYSLIVGVNLLFVSIMFMCIVYVCYYCNLGFCVSFLCFVVYFLVSTSASDCLE